jgi:predicted nucleic acid-binding protein
VTVVSNSSPLISLAKIEMFHLLGELYGKIIISAEVYAEVVIAGAGFPAHPKHRASRGFIASK